MSTEAVVHAAAEPVPQVTTPGGDLQNKSAVDTAESAVSAGADSPQLDFLRRKSIESEELKDLLDLAAVTTETDATPEEVTPSKQAETPASAAAPETPRQEDAPAQGSEEEVNPSPEKKKRKSIVSKIRKSLGLPKGTAPLAEPALTFDEIEATKSAAGSPAPRTPASPDAETPEPEKAEGEKTEKPTSVFKQIRKSLGFSGKKSPLSDEELAKIEQEEKEKQNTPLDGSENSSSPAPVPFAAASQRDPTDERAAEPEVIVSPLAAQQQEQPSEFPKIEVPPVAAPTKAPAAPTASAAPVSGAANGAAPQQFYGRETGPPAKKAAPPQGEECCIIF